MGDYHSPTDQILLAGMLERLALLPGARDVGPLKRLLQDPARIPEIAANLIQDTRLGDVAFVEESLSLTPEQLRESNDPLLRLIVELYPTYLEMRELDKEREGRLSRLYGSLIEVKQQFLATDFVPDANATLRFTCGRIRSYSPEDAVIKTPITTLSGVIEKTTGVEPFITPEKLLEARAENRLVAFAINNFRTYRSPFFTTPTPRAAIPAARYSTAKGAWSASTSIAALKPPSTTSLGIKATVVRSASIFAMCCGSPALFTPPSTCCKRWACRRESNARRPVARVQTLCGGESRSIPRCRNKSLLLWLPAAGRELVVHRLWRCASRLSRGGVRPTRGKLCTARSNSPRTIPVFRTRCWPSARTSPTRIRSPSSSNRSPPLRPIGLAVQ